MKHTVLLTLPLPLSLSLPYSLTLLSVLRINKEVYLASSPKGMIINYIFIYSTVYTHLGAVGDWDPSLDKLVGHIFQLKIQKVQVLDLAELTHIDFLLLQKCYEVTYLLNIDTLHTKHVLLCRHYYMVPVLTNYHQITITWYYWSTAVKISVLAEKSAAYLHWRDSVS